MYDLPDIRVYGTPRQQVAGLKWPSIHVFYDFNYCVITVVLLTIMVLL
jgi:hypothetical protein